MGRIQDVGQGLSNCAGPLVSKIKEERQHNFGDDANARCDVLHVNAIMCMGVLFGCAAFVFRKRPPFSSEEVEAIMYACRSLLQSQWNADDNTANKILVTVEQEWDSDESQQAIRIFTNRTVEYLRCHPEYAVRLVLLSEQVTTGLKIDHSSYMNDNRVMEELERRGTEEKAKKSGCFVASICYGNPDAAEVNVLRRYRDEVLMETVYGRYLVEMYYYVGPFVARVLGRQRWLAGIVQHVMLDRIVNKLQKQHYTSRR